MTRYKSTLLPSPVFKEDEARNAEFDRWAEEDAREKREHLFEPKVTSARYEPDLLQYQRSLRAAEADRRRGFDMRVDGRTTPEQARQIKGSDQANFGRKNDRELGAMSPEQGQETLPACAQDFLRGRMTADPAVITLHKGGGGLPNWFGSHVTYGDDIHLTEGTFDRHDRAALRDKFHEIGHVDQNARLGLSPLDHAAAYLVFGGHDASPHEKAADNFADKAFKDYIAAGLDKKCRF